MSLRFACPHCHQKLSVSADKAGQKRNCPKCKQPIVVPHSATSGSASTIGNQVATSDASPATGGIAPPTFEQFEVYDDDTEILYDAEIPAYVPGGVPKLVDRVSVPRWSIYVQGGLLAGLSFLCFMLGLCAGGLGSGGAGGGGQTTGPKYGDLYGRVTYQLAQQQTGDDGAIIIVLPQKQIPDEKAPTADLFSETAIARPTHRGLEIIRLIGGGSTRADKTGNFKLQLSRGDYFILVVSNIKQRPANVAVPTAEIAQMGRFLEQPVDFIGRKMYRWDKISIKGDQRYDVSFE